MSTKHVEIFTALAAEFRKEEVKTRPQGGRQLSYITARTAMNRLDDVLGPENWWDDYRLAGEALICRLSIRLPDGLVVAKEDAGGAAGMSDAGDDDKSQFSDAFKRAAVKFGIGRYLYRDGVPRFATTAQEPPRTPARPPGRPPADHHAANHDNATGHGSGAYASPETVKEVSAWIEKYCGDINAVWLDHITDRQGEVKGPGEIVTTWRLSGHLLKFARANAMVHAPEDVRAGQRDKFLAVAWERFKPALEEEAREYCRRLWREAKAKLTAEPSPVLAPADESDGEPIPDPDAWEPGRE